MKKRYMANSMGLKSRTIFLLTFAVTVTPLAHGAGLLDLYVAAKESDPQFASAKAEWQSVQTLFPQAIGQLLPQISFSGARINNEVDNQTQLGNTKRSIQYDFVSKSASLNLSLAIFRPQLWFGFLESQAQIKQGDSQLKIAFFDLVLRLSQAYFDVLLAEDNLAFSREQLAAINEQLKQANRYFEAGVGTVTDINEAQARRDTVAAQELAALGNLEIRRRALEQISGLHPKQLNGLGEFPLEPPEPLGVESWIDVALSNNPTIMAREAALEIAQQDHNRSRAAHLPTLDLVASRGISENPSYTTIDQTNWTSTMGLQFSMPIFSGGSIHARANQTAAKRDRAKFELETAKRGVIHSTRQEYINLTNGIAQIKALMQAVKSNDLALYSARKGQEAGLRTSFDVLNAQQLVFQAKRDLAQERYRYLLARLKLRASVGLLNEGDVELFDRWLSKNANIY